MLDLPNVTLIVVETRSHELMRLSLNDITSKVKFGGGVVIYTDHPELVQVLDAQYHLVPNWSNKIEAGKFYYQDAAQGASTSHALLMEWDGGLRDLSMWRDEFLTYDYIGAPWVWPTRTLPDYLVGNGGFMLISKRLADAVYKDQLGIATDVLLAREHRLHFEQSIDAKWAPIDVAYHFSYEHGGDRNHAAPSFGYHDVFNWPIALSKEEVIHRARLLMNSQYGRATGKLDLLCRDWPWVAPAIGYNMRHRAPMRVLHRRHPIPGRSGFGAGQKA